MVVPVPMDVHASTVEPHESSGGLRKRQWTLLGILCCFRLFNDAGSFKDAGPFHALPEMCNLNQPSISVNWGVGTTLDEWAHACS